jgi:hypothetical protein
MDTCANCKYSEFFRRGQLRCKKSDAEQPAYRIVVRRNEPACSDFERYPGADHASEVAGE